MLPVSGYHPKVKPNKDSGEGCKVKWIWMAIAFCVALLAVTLIFKVWTADLDYQSQASVEINAPADEVFRKIGNLANWPEWSPFIPANAPIIQIDQTASPPLMTWIDPRGGQSELTLDRLDAVAGEIDQTLQSKIFPPMTGTFKIVPAPDNRVTVTWEVEGSLPNSFFYALAAGNYGEMFKSQLQQSLERLKTVCENELEEVTPEGKTDGKNVNGDAELKKAA